MSTKSSSSFGQARQVLTFIDDQKLDRGQSHDLIECLPAFVEGIKRGKFNPIYLRLLARGLGEARITKCEFELDFDGSNSFTDHPLYEILPDRHQLPNRAKGVQKLELQKLALAAHDTQKYGWVRGLHLRKKLRDFNPVYGVRLRDFYLANPYLIPQWWEVFEVFFWGTILRDRKNGALCVPSMFFEGKWLPNIMPLVNNFSFESRAVTTATT